MWEYIPIGIGVVIAIVIVLSGLKTIRPTHVGAIETFGKYSGYKTDGLTFVIPFVQQLKTINITEQLHDVEKQDVITKENLNCKVDAQVYYKVKKDEASMKKALYEVSNVSYQIVELAQSTLRSVIGQKMFKDVNANRQELNRLIFAELSKQADMWGVSIVRVELKEIYPPSDVQQKMNDIIKAENEKDKQKDLAEALRIETEGKKAAQIIAAEAQKQTAILQAEALKEKQRIEAEGEKEKIRLQSEADKIKQELIASGQANAIKAVADADAKRINMIAAATAEKIKLENEALTTYFKDNAIKYKELNTVVDALDKNTKLIITDPKNPLSFILNESKDAVIPTSSFSPKKPTMEHRPIS